MPHDSLLSLITSSSRAWDGFRPVATADLIEQIESMRRWAPCEDLPRDRAEFDAGLLALAKQGLVVVEGGMVTPVARELPVVVDVMQPEQTELAFT